MAFIGRNIILALSRAPGEPDLPDGSRASSRSDPLEPLRAAFPTIEKLCVGRRVVDFGCGAGAQAVEFARLGATHVYATDIVPSQLTAGAMLAERAGVADRVSFVEQLPEDVWGNADLVISQDSVEHVLDLDEMFSLWARALHPGGSAVITFGPPWFAPYGAHMHFFTKVPWVHLLFSEAAVMSARGEFRHDGAKRYQDVEGGLGKVSVRRFRRAVSRRSDFVIEELQVTAVKDISALARVPVLGELFSNNVHAVLKRV